jgi:hypothetical protein
VFVETTNGWISTRAVGKAVVTSNGIAEPFDLAGQPLGHSLDPVDPQNWGDIVPAQPERWATTIRLNAINELVIGRRLIYAWRDCGRYMSPVYTEPAPAGEVAFLKAPNGLLIELAGENAVTVANLEEAKRLLIFRAEQARARHARRQSLSLAAE